MNRLAVPLVFGWLLASFVGVLISCLTGGSIKRPTDQLDAVSTQSKGSYPAPPCCTIHPPHASQPFPLLVHANSANRLAVKTTHAKTETRNDAYTNSAVNELNCMTIAVPAHPCTDCNSTRQPGGGGGRCKGRNRQAEGKRIPATVWRHLWELEKGWEEK